VFRLLMRAPLRAWRPARLYRPRGAGSGLRARAVLLRRRARL